MKTSLIKNAEELKLAIISLEKDLLVRAIECARKEFTNLLERIDALFLCHRPAELKVAHKRSTWYRTWLGPVRVTRRQYREASGRYRYLLDELMEMGKYSHITFAVKEIACRLAGEMPFRKSAEVLDRTTSIDLSYKTIHRLVQTVLADSQEKTDYATTWLAETGELPQSEGKKTRRLMIEADGVILPLQREAAHKAEVKLGIAYEGWKKMGKNRYGTINKIAYADIVDTDRFWTAMTLKLHQKYSLNETQYIIGGDGAAWIKEGIDYFGAQYQLCRYHLNRALCHALGHDRATLKSIQHHCSNGNFADALKQLKESANNAAADKAKDIRRVIKYISSNAHGLKDYRQDMEQADTSLRRTGAIEGNIDKLIVRRMKNQGMSWSLQGIRRMLWLRINMREGTLSDCLHSFKNRNAPVKMPDKKIMQVIDRTVKNNYSHYFSAALPAITGPHASRYWVEILKSLTRIAV